ncbi:hypothetical protein P4475_12015 [Halalkalibacterium halodurans]|uniref:YqgU-like beta propeller domain-containing protein n=1 Tax=Halalkalibacterium halodurans TaxID=86665 RepID=UPI002E1BC132|nr:hypothetical protein [Halalkalibacterium halodurans]
MKYRAVLLSVCLLFIAGCFPQADEPERDTLPEQEEDPLPTGQEQPSITPIPGTEAQYIDIAEWYDSDSILYITDEGENSLVYIYNLLTGEKESLFSSDDAVIKVTANSTHSQFAIQTVTQAGDAPVSIIDSQGELLTKLEDFGEDFSIFWSPYEEDKLIAVAYLPDWEQDLYLIDTSDKQVEMLDLDQSFVQWLDERTIVYLDWNGDSEGYYAPLYTFDLETEEVVLLHEEAIATLGFGDHVTLIIERPEQGAEVTTYQFWNGSEQLAEWSVPILRTYSEQWWIPFYDFDLNKRLFYAYKPNRTGDYFEYDGGFSFIAFDVDHGEETVLFESDEHVPFRLSPTGQRALFGPRLETVMDLLTGESNSLIE